jgi:hypothetical protein
MANDVMMGYSSHNLSTKFLTEDEIKQRCPLAFRTDPTNPKVSEKYVQANTATVINDMAKLGWYVVDAKQKGKRKNSSGIQSFHMVSFQNPDIKVMENNEVEAFPRIILTNSHDGMNSFKFMIGLYRLVCSNGLIVADETFEELTIRHINYNFNDLRHLVTKTVEALPQYIETVNKMKSTQLTTEQKHDFALKMLKLRKNVPADTELKVSEATLDDILTPARQADEGDSVWNVFNVLQEKMIKGGSMIESGKNNKLRKMRPVKSFVRDLNVNYSMYQTAMTYLDAA